MYICILGGWIDLPHLQKNAAKREIYQSIYYFDINYPIVPMAAIYCPYTEVNKNLTKL